jgi:hypothetical protein
MSRRRAVPSYRKDTQSGQAVVTFRLPTGKRKDYLLGSYGSRESKAEYARLLAEFQAGHGAMAGVAEPVADLTVNELLVRYLRHCDQYYRNADGTPTGQAAGVRFALRAPMDMYGHTPAGDFGPLALKVGRAPLVDAGNSRKTVNVRVGLVRQFFKWCVAEELIPSSIVRGAPNRPGPAARPNPGARPQAGQARRHRPRRGRPPLHAPTSRGIGPASVDERGPGRGTACPTGGRRRSVEPGLGVSAAATQERLADPPAGVLLRAQSSGSVAPLVRAGPR